MRKVFVGSSSEALGAAKQISEMISSVRDVKAELWTKVFNPSLITFEAIERKSREIAGAILIATPDDEIVLRGEAVRAPRANVMIELGYLCAILGRERVVLCKYDNTHLATDLAGFTYVGMGPFNDGGSQDLVNANAQMQLMTWAQDLKHVIPGLPHSNLRHGYSGRWKARIAFNRWRGIQIVGTDFVQFRGDLTIDIPPDGISGCGTVHGSLEIQVGACKARFLVTDTVTNILVGADGSLSFDSIMHNRQQVYMYGEPPQEDGFEEELTSVFEYRWNTYPPRSAHNGCLEGTYSARAGHHERSAGHATLEKYR